MTPLAKRYLALIPIYIFAVLATVASWLVAGFTYAAHWLEQRYPHP